VTVIDDIAVLFAGRGTQSYLGEPVSLAEHMLQTAAAAEAGDASPPLIVAALLHDLGHLVHDLPEDAAEHDVDTVHEVAGARWLAGWFPADVTEPIRLHVDAKRYLCATEPAYLSQLSPASVHSLNLQGGPFSAADAAAFARLPFAADAVRVRRWDDVGKVAGRVTSTFEHFRSVLLSSLV
jgi:gamma-butyrobetaine dioxygenase